MFVHYLKIAFRNLWKYKTQHIISMIGLVVAFVCVVISATWIHYETSYDTFHQHAADIHRVIFVDKEDTNEYSGTTPAPLALKLQQLFVEIEAASTVRFWCWGLLQYDGREIDKCYHVDTCFFDVFSAQFILGNAKTAFIDQHSVVITESTANKLFGSPGYAMGKIINSKTRQGEESHNYKINGVIKDFKHSNLCFDVLVKFTPTKNDDWSNHSYATFIRVKDGINKTDFYNKLKNITLKEVSDKDCLQSVPLTKIRYQYSMREQVYILPFIYIVVLSGMSLLLFVCALFNYLSLFFSLMLTRVRELGLRKVVGAEMRQLIGLLATEFVFTMLLAFLVGACIVGILFPTLEQVAQISVDKGQISTIIIVFALIGIILPLIIAIYPMSRVCNIAAQRSMVGKGLTGRQRLQKVLLVMQLAIGIVLMFITLVMFRQLHFMRTSDLGFDRKGVLRVETSWSDRAKFTENADIICQELLKSTSIQEILKQGVDFFANNGTMSTNGIDWDGKAEDLNLLVAHIEADENFIDFFHIPMKAGRFYSKDIATDAGSLVINEKLAKRIPEPVGKIITFQGRQREIIGVMADIQDRSLQYELLPTVITWMKQPYFLYIRVAAGKEDEARQYIGKVFERHGILNLTAQSMDDVLNDFSKSETIMMKFVGMVAAICLIISVFGIYSLSLYSLERRRREVAIRKAAGADAKNIVRLFLKEYLWLALIACVVAVPSAYYMMNQWLQGYANRINITWWLIASIVITVLLIMVITVLWQIVKAANENPAEVIKSE